MEKAGKLLINVLLINVLMLLAFVAVLTNCGGGGGGGGSSLQPPAANLTGTWYKDETIGNNSCGDTVGSHSYDTGTVTHAAGSNSFTLTSNGIQFQGTISGTDISISGTNVPDSSGGYDDWTFSGTLNTSTMTISGTSNWSWKPSTSASASCSGTSSVTVTCTNCSSGGSSYSVTYNGNGNTGGSAPIDSTNYQQGQAVTILGNTGNLVKTGYSFAGWNTQANGSGTTYTQGQTFVMGSANVALYAKWTTNTTYSVTYNGNGNTGGSAPIDSTNYQQGQTVTVLGNTGNLVKTGYSFAGWNTQANGSGTTYTQGQTFVMGSANVVLYAKWTTAATVPAAPTNLAATGITQTGATLTWTDNATNETGYEIGQCTGLVSVDSNGHYFCTSGFSKVTPDAAANATSYTLTGLSAATTYNFYVRAYNSTGASAAPLVTFTTSSTTQTVTFNPQYDNCLEYDGYSSSYANTVYPNCTVPIGVNWYTDVVNFCVANPAYAAVVKFNLSTLAGKTIDSATLKLTATNVGVGYYPQNFKIYVVATSWNPSTVTWNIASNFSVYTSLTENYPTYVGEIYGVNLKTIVQNWANGSYANNGLAFESTTYSLCPGVMSFDAYEFAAPSLTVTYH